MVQLVESLCVCECSALRLLRHTWLKRRMGILCFGATWRTRAAAPASFMEM